MQAKSKSNARTVHVVSTRTMIAKALALVAHQEHILGRKVPRAFTTVFPSVVMELTLRLAWFLALNALAIATAANRQLAASKIVKHVPLTPTLTSRQRPEWTSAEQSATQGSTLLPDWRRVHFVQRITISRRLARALAQSVLRMPTLRDRGLRDERNA